MKLKVVDDIVVTLDYTLFVEDEMMESTADGDPIQFIQGIGQIIPGLENALYGLEVGAKKTILIQPEDAYGDYDSESIEVCRVGTRHVAAGALHERLRAATCDYR